MLQGKLCEVLALMATIDPATVNSTPVYSDTIDMAECEEAVFFALLGNMPAETIDFSLEKCTAADGTGNTAITGKAATQLAAHASNNDNKQLAINIRSEEISGSSRYVRAKLVTGNTTGGPACVVGIGAKLRNGPASDNDLASVAEIIA